MNIAITNVSRISFDKETKKIREITYEDQDKNQFTGRMTNEAPLKSLKKRLNLIGEKLDRIIYIESDSVRKQKNIPDYGCFSDADFLRYLIKESEGEPLQYDSEKDSISIMDEPDEAAVSETVFSVRKRILELYEESQQSENDKKLNVFIESNGGVRYVLTMLLSIMRTLENSLENMHIAEILSMVFNQDSAGKTKVTRINNTKMIFDTTQITSIVEEYVNYGRINSMKQYVKRLFDSFADDEVKMAAEKIMQDLEKLAEDIQLCRSKRILDDFYSNGGIRKTIDDNFLEKYKDREEAEVKIFNFVLQYIRDEFEKFIYNGYDKHNKENAIYLPNVIRWCLDKDFIQQALTLCAERLAEYLFNSGKMVLSDELQSLLNEAKTDDYERSYYFLANMRQYFLSKMDNAKIKAALDEMKGIDNAHRLLTDEEWGQIRVDTSLPYRAGVNCDSGTMTNNIYNMALSYKLLSQDDDYERRIRDLLINYGFNEDSFEKIIAVSNNQKGRIIDILQGKSFGKDETLHGNQNLGSKEKRLVKVLPKLIELSLPSMRGLEEYMQMINELFREESPEFKDALIKKYAEKQSEKYYVREAMLPKFNHIRTNMPGGADELQRILYLFSICKEQRNFSNHAFVSDDDQKIAMDLRQMKILISGLLRACGVDIA